MLFRSLAILEANNVQSLNDHVELITDTNGFLTLQFSGVNVQIINGFDQNTVNGVGNLVVGYNPESVSAIFFCESGQYDNQNDCEINNWIWSNNQRTGSHNLIVGSGNSYTRRGGAVLGQHNASSEDYSSVMGGFENLASGLLRSVGGGKGNKASGTLSSVGGGSTNTASGLESHVSSGINNTASALQSSVSGGSGNNASGNQSSISGGTVNTASGTNSSVTGGGLNIAAGTQSSVSGGAIRSAPTFQDWAAGSLLENN